MEITRDKVAYLNCTRVGSKAQNFMIKLEIFGASVLPDLYLAERTHLHWSGAILQEFADASCTESVSAVR
jgi:hypothetical protein